MAGTFVNSEREKIYIQDVQGGASVSESVAAKLSASINFILDNITQKMQFGVTGNFYSDLILPYTFSQNSEVAAENLLIQRLNISQQISGISGQTEFKIEKRLAGGGTWNNIFSTNCIISNLAIDNLVFSSDDMTAPLNVTMPVLSITTLAKGDELRFVLINSANQARNLLVDLELSPI
jgi:hypothetical protein